MRRIKNESIKERMSLRLFFCYFTYREPSKKNRVEIWEADLSWGECEHTKQSQFSLTTSLCTWSLDFGYHLVS
jgi:hypothetical protein